MTSALICAIGWPVVSSMPDKYEAGTPNIPGIFGLNASLKYLKDAGLKNIREKEYELLKLFLDEMKQIKGIAVVGKDAPHGRTGVVSLDFIDAGLAFQTDDRNMHQGRAQLIIALNSYVDHSIAL